MPARSKLGLCRFQPLREDPREETAGVKPCGTEDLLCSRLEQLPCSTVAWVQPLMPYRKSVRYRVLFCASVSVTTEPCHEVATRCRGVVRRSSLLAFALVLALAMALALVVSRHFLRALALALALVLALDRSHRCLVQSDILYCVETGPRALHDAELVRPAEQELDVRAEHWLVEFLPVFRDNGPPVLLRSRLPQAVLDLADGLASGVPHRQLRPLPLDEKLVLAAGAVHSLFGCEGRGRGHLRRGEGRLGPLLLLGPQGLLLGLRGRRGGRLLSGLALLLLLLLVLLRFPRCLPCHRGHATPNRCRRCSRPCCAALRGGRRPCRSPGHVGTAAARPPSAGCDPARRHCGRHHHRTASGSDPCRRWVSARSPLEARDALLLSGP
mmetsp:Transcript_75853/g.209366  ORF Transcript_75853/g.209366 Transcript_75853/m.209366 type:complete len:384 (+) Transcript_75853:791-1942(+)